jgi:hypothetical protein
MSHPLDPAPTPPPRERPADSFLDFDGRVDALAAHSRIESAQVGFAGAPSSAYQAFRDLVDHATDEELEELLTHESPVVRGYVAGYLVSKYGPGHPVLQPLHEDKAEVFTMVGCIGGMTTVAEMAQGMWRLD